MNQIITVAKKEFYEHIKSKRLLIIGGIFGCVFLLAIGLTASTNPDPISVLNQSHQWASTLYIFLGMVMSYDLIVRETSEKSIYLLLSKPVTREEVVVGKFLGTLASIGVVVIPVVIAGSLLAMGMSGTWAGFGKLGAYLGIVILGIGCWVALGEAISSATKKGVTALISMLGAWFALSMIFGIVSIALVMSSGINLTDPTFATSPEFLARAQSWNSLWYVKLAYAINPGNCMNGAVSYMLGDLMPSNVSAAGSAPAAPLSFGWMIVSMVIFIVVMLGMALTVFKRKDLT